MKPRGVWVGRGLALLGLAAVVAAVQQTHGRTLREAEGTYGAVGDSPFGAGLLLAERDAASGIAQAVGEELRRLVASMRLAHLHQVGEQPAQLVAKQLAAIAAGTKTLEGVAKAGV